MVTFQKLAFVEKHVYRINFSGRSQRDEINQKKLVRKPVLYCLHVHRVFYADYQTIFTKTERGIQVVYFRTYQYLYMNARFNLQFF